MDEIKLRKLLPYDSWREGQKDIALKVYNVIKEGRNLLVEAPTGSGKTLATLLGSLKAAKEEGLKVFFLARTKNQALTPLKEALKIAKKGLDVKVAVFRSKKDMCALNEVRSLNYEEFIEYCSFLRNEGICKYFSRTAAVNEEELKPLLRDFKSPLEVIRKLKERGYCPYEALRKWGERADLIIGSYPYIFNEVVRSAFLTSLNLKLNELVLIIDEAHNLYDYLSEAYSGDLPLAYVKKARGEIRKYLKDMHELYYTVADTLLRIERYLVKLRANRELSKPELLALYSDLRSLEEASKIVTKRKREIEGSPLCYTKRVLKFLKLLESSGEDYILLSLPTEFGPKLVLQCILPSFKASEVFSSVRTSILISATMPPKEFMVDLVGVGDKVGELRVKVRYMRDNREILIASDVTSKFSERGEEIYKRMAEYVISSYEALPINGVILVVAPSYEFATSLSRYLKEVELIKEHEGTKIEEVSKAVLSKVDSKVVLLAVAGGKMVEGVELVKGGKSLIRAVIIAGLPYPEPSPRTLGLKRVLMGKLRDERRAWEEAFLVPMLVKVKQAIGRAVRSEKDRAVTLILDRRALDRRVLGELKSLSRSVKVVNRISEVKNFFIEFFKTNF